MLLIRKARGPYTGAYDLPGGKIEFGESPSDALRREIFEETGLTVQHAELIDGLSHRVQYEENTGDPVDLHHLGFLYRVTVADDTTPRVDPDGEDSLGTVWIPIAELDQKTLSPFARIAVKCVGG